MMLIPILSFVLALACYIIGINTRKQQARLKKWALVKNYEKLIFQYQAVIDHCELIGERIIALDRNNKKIFVVDHTGNKKESQCIPLRLINSVTIKEETGKGGIIAKLFLVLENKHCMVYNICFFDRRHESAEKLPIQWRSALQWTNRIHMYKRKGKPDLEQEFML